jgi:hypothetical protein
MQTDLAIYVFKSDKTYGFTKDPIGTNLPRYSSPWQFTKSLSMRPGERPRIAVNIDEVRRGIAEHGYHLVEPKVEITRKSVPR